jgi:hypothetical protein
MGTFHNQPEFATEGEIKDLAAGYNLLDGNQQAVYVATNGHISLIPGNQAKSHANVITFKNVQAGTFMPVIAGFILPRELGSGAATYKVLADGVNLFARISGQSEETDSNYVAGTYTVNCQALDSNDSDAAIGNTIPIEIIVVSTSVTSIIVKEPIYDLVANDKIQIPANALGTHSAFTVTLAGADLANATSTTCHTSLGATSQGLAMFK